MRFGKYLQNHVWGFASCFWRLSSTCAICSLIFSLLFCCFAACPKGCFCFFRGLAATNKANSRQKIRSTCLRKILCKGFDVWWGQPYLCKKHPRRQDEETVSGYLPSCFSSKSSEQIGVFIQLKSGMAVIHSTLSRKVHTVFIIYYCFPASSPP